MNEIINKFLSAGEIFISEMYLKQLGFTYSADHLLKTRKEFKTLKENRDSRYIYQNELNKACSQRDMAYGDFKDLPRGTAADKALRDKRFILLKMLDMLDINTNLFHWFIILLIKRLLVVLLKIKSFKLGN